MSRVPDIRNAMIIVYIIAIITFDYFHVFLLDLLNMLGGPMQESWLQWNIWRSFSFQDIPQSDYNQTSICGVSLGKINSFDIGKFRATRWILELQFASIYT